MIAVIEAVEIDFIRTPLKVVATIEALCDKIMTTPPASFKHSYVTKSPRSSHQNITNKC